MTEHQPHEWQTSTIQQKPKELLYTSAIGALFVLGAVILSFWGYGYQERKTEFNAYRQRIQAVESLIPQQAEQVDPLKLALITTEWRQVVGDLYNSNLSLSQRTILEEEGHLVAKKIAISVINHLNFKRESLLIDEYVELVYALNDLRFPLMKEPIAASDLANLKASLSVAVLVYAKSTPLEQLNSQQLTENIVILDRVLSMKGIPNSEDLSSIRDTMSKRLVNISSVEGVPDDPYQGGQDEWALIVDSAKGEKVEEASSQSKGTIHNRLAFIESSSKTLENKGVTLGISGEDGTVLEISGDRDTPQLVELLTSSPALRNRLVALGFLRIKASGEDGLSMIIPLVTSY